MESCMQSQSRTERKPDNRLQYVLCGVWILSYFAARLVLKAMGEPAAEWSRLAVALLPLVPFVLFLMTFIRSIRKADELERKVHLEALAIAFPLGLVLIMILALVQVAIPLNTDTWSYRHVWPFFFFFWLFGLTVARQRYQ